MEGRGRLGVRGRFQAAGVNDCVVSDGFLLSLSMCRRGFHDLLSVRPSSLLIISSTETSALKAQTLGDYPQKKTQYGINVRCSNLVKFSSRPALGSTQSLSQWITANTFLQVKRLEL